MTYTSRQCLNIVARVWVQATCHSKHSIKVGPLHSRAWLSVVASSSTVHALTACFTPMPRASNTQSIHGCPMSVSACDAVDCPLCGIFWRANSSCKKHMRPCQIQKQRKCMHMIPGAAPAIFSRSLFWYMQDSVRCSLECTTCCVQLVNTKIISHQMLLSKLQHKWLSQLTFKIA